jgi:hypothetical protein
MAASNTAVWPAPTTWITTSPGRACSKSCAAPVNDTFLRTGRVSQTSTYARTSLPATAATVAQLNHCWRGHWTIANRVHAVRDVSLGEAAQQLHTGHAPQVLAALRNAVLNLLRAAGWTNIAAAQRHYSYAPTAALHVLGVPVP